MPSFWVSLGTSSHGMQLVLSAELTSTEMGPMWPKFPVLVMLQITDYKVLSKTLPWQYRSISKHASKSGWSHVAGAARSEGCAVI